MQEIGIETKQVLAILEGRKTIEGRLGKPRFLKLRVGDELSVREDVWEDEKIIRSIPYRTTIRITQKLYFETFEEMLSSIDYTAAIPDAESVEEALAVYRVFYTPQDEDEYGVVAITFETVG